MILRRVLLPLLLTLLTACSDGSDHGPVTFIDSADPQILIAGNGDIVLQIAGRTLFAMPGDKAPLAREFTETASGIGVIGFTRENETVDPLNLMQSQQVGAGVKLEFQNSEGSRQASLEPRPVRTGNTFIFLRGPGTTCGAVQPWREARA